jgi:uncharacterized damage-inducible protein DinB
MKEMKRIAKMMDDIYDGSPWIDVTLVGTLQKVTAEQAARRIAPHWNTIWEIVNHMISWRLNVLQRVQGEVIKTPASNYFEPVTDTSPEAWRATLGRLEESQKQWKKLLKKFKKSDLEKEYPNNGQTYYEHIHAIIQHDHYHLGQLVLLAKNPS